MTIDRRNELKPIVLFHGFQCTGSFWIITAAGRLMNDGNYYEYDENGHLRHNDTDMTVGNTLGFVLANRGYDVWLANYRGSVYSNNHIKFNTKSMLSNNNHHHNYNNYHHSHHYYRSSLLVIFNR